MGEQAARSYLSKQRYLILNTNWRCPLGELDIVARDSDTLVIVEVKTRHASISDTYSPIDAVDGEKQRRLTRLADHYIETHPRLKFRAVRFDVVAVYYLNHKNSRRFTFQLEHLVNVGA